MHHIFKISKKYIACVWSRCEFLTFLNEFTSVFATMFIWYSWILIGFPLFVPVLSHLLGTSWGTVLGRTRVLARTIAGEIHKKESGTRLESPSQHCSPSTCPARHPTPHVEAAPSPPLAHRPEPQHRSPSQGAGYQSGGQAGRLEKRTLPGDPVSISSFDWITALDASRSQSPSLQVWGSAPDSLFLSSKGSHCPTLRNGIHPSLRNDWPMFNCCSHGTLYPLQPLKLSYEHYNQDLHLQWLYLGPCQRLLHHHSCPPTCHSLGPEMAMAMVLLPISTNTFYGAWWVLASGTITRHSVHATAPVLLTKCGPLGAHIPCLAPSQDSYPFKAWK